jgi:Fic family protein
MGDMKTKYIHLEPDWPALRWATDDLSFLLAETRHAQGRLLGRMEGLGFRLCSEADLAVMTDEVVKSSAIEGETLDMQQVRASLARRLGIDVGGAVPGPRAVDGIVEMMLDATRNFGQPLTAERLFGWHAALFPTGRSGIRKITVGAWRPVAAGPMQVVSGPIGRERVHFEAPDATRLAGEMAAFLKWFNAPLAIDPVLKAGVAHFHCVTIHPFEDGNGRIARAIADMALARADGRPERFYSMSAQIEAERGTYYEVLEDSQKGGLDITPWLKWFLECLGRALTRAEATLAVVLRKAHVWQRIGTAPFNERQRKVINRLLDGFEGKLTTSKYAKLTACSNDTALRDIQALVAQGVLARNEGGGRSVSYRMPE